MKFNIKKNNFDFFRRIPDKCRLICGKKRWLLALFGLLLFVFCAYLWNKYIYNPNLSEAEKQDYVQSKYKETNFNRNVFDKVLKEITDKKQKFNEKVEFKNDIFKVN